MPDKEKDPMLPTQHPEREATDPFIVYTRFSYPQRHEFSPEELEAVRSILPDYDAPMLHETPWPFSPENFSDIKARQNEMQSGELNIIRSHHDELRMRRRREELRTKNIDVNEYVRSIVFPTGAETYTLRFDEFPSNVPQDTQHYNLWLKDPDLSPAELSIVTADCLRFLGVDAEEAVIIEKKRQARTAATKGQIYLGITPTVKEIRHPHLYVVKKPSQRIFIRS